ncbi:MAG: LacI family transcriptional regulator [Chloroflexi bacterium]|nr:LacI family transcriptional regulator [Chloroflexota bacterium]
MAYNIEEIAKRAGVSRSTVSRAINNAPEISTETRAKVLAVVEELNYQPSAAARGLAAGRTRVIGLVIPMTVTAFFADPFFPLLIQGVSSASNARDHSVMLWIAEPEFERRTVRQVLNNGLIDGVVMASQVTDDPVIEALLNSGLPLVLIGRHPTEQNVTYVYVDNEQSARQAVEHLLRLGRRRIATIAGPGNMIAGVHRLNGYLAALRDAGIDPDPDLIVKSDFSELGGYVATQRLVAHDLDAIFAASDSIAVGAIRALRESGRRVPQDVAIVGFDDMPFAARAEPPLTTVRQPVQQTGRVAAETLINLIEHPDLAPCRVILPTELVIRESCGSGMSSGDKRQVSTP